MCSVRCFNSCKQYNIVCNTTFDISSYYSFFLSLIGCEQCWRYSPLLFAPYVLGGVRRHFGVNLGKSPTVFAKKEALIFPRDWSMP